MLPTMTWLQTVLLTLLNLSGRIECVRLIKLTVPAFKFIDDEAALTCRFDLEGEELYSIKWYKDGDEFYRYIPGDREQQVTVFNMNGVRVDERRSNKNTVILLGLNLKSAGNYRCEVSAEAPLFNTVSQRSRMEVIVLPNSRPRISGGQHTYHVGDWVRVNCTSDKSKPAADLQWYINGREAPQNLLRPYPPIQHEDGLETSIKGLDFRVSQQSFRNQPGKLSLTLKCVSAILKLDNYPRYSEVRHQKESTHFSIGSLFHSGTSDLQCPSLPSMLLLLVIFWLQSQVRR